MWSELVGTTLDDRLKIIRTLGVGGFGAVFLAEDYVAGQFMRRVAVKVVLSDQLRRPGQIGELKSAINLDHPGIVRCYSVGHCPIRVRSGTAEVLYLVLELGSTSLATRVETVPLTTDEAGEMA